MAVAANLIGAQSTLTPGLRADFTKTYKSTYKVQDDMMGKVMDLSKKSDGRYEIYAYYKAAPYPERWDIGNAIAQSGMSSVQWTTYNDRFGKRIMWQQEDEDDDRTDSLFMMAQDAGRHFATLDERIFFQILQNGSDPELLSSIPNAPDGAALYSATDGDSNDRFQVSGGNIITGISNPTADDIRDQYHDAIKRFTDFRDTQGEPLIDAGTIGGGMLIIYGTLLTREMREAFEQRMVLQQVNGTGAAAAPSNIIVDAGDNVTLWRSPRITTKRIYIVLTQTPTDKKPIYRQEREPVRESPATRENSDLARDLNVRYLQWHCRRGYGVALPYHTLAITNSGTA